MTTLTITAKGQVTLKQGLLKHLGVSPGQKIEVDELPEGRAIERAARQDGAMSDFIGCLSRQGTRKLTLDEIDKAVAQEAILQSQRSSARLLS